MSLRTNTAAVARGASRCRRGLVATIGVASVSLIAAACSGAGDRDGAEGGDMSLTYALGVVTPDMTTSYYSSLPSVLGFWQEDGLNVKTIVVDGSTPVMQAIETGRADVGQMGTSSMAVQIGEGSNLKGYFALVPNQYSYPVVLPDSPIESLEDLNGKTIGVSSLESGTVPLAKAWVNLGGGDASTLQFRAVGAGTGGMVALQQGNVDALNLYDAPYARIEAAGQELRPVNDNEVGAQAGFQTVIAATSEDLDGAKQEALAAFGRGLAKSIVFAKANPACGVYAHWEAFPASKPTGLSEEEALADAVLLWEAREPNTGPVDDKYGYSSPDQVSGIIEMLEVGGVLDSGLTPESISDFDAIDQINDFDREAIEAKAEACDYPWAPQAVKK